MGRPGFAQHLQHLDANFGISIVEQGQRSSHVGDLAEADTHAVTPDRVDAGEARRVCLQGERQHLRPGSEAMEPDRGVDADALVTVSEHPKQLLLRNRDRKRLGEDRLGGLVDVRRDLDTPDRAFAIEGVAADPVCEIGATIRRPGHADAHQAVIDHAELILAKSVAVGDKREGVHLPLWELIEDEMCAQVAVERVAWFEEEAGRAVGIVGDGRGDGQRLVGRAGRHPHILFHPAALDGLILVLVAPAGVGAFQQIHQAFALLRLVAVVVHADHVAEGIESDLLGVTDAVGEDFEAAAVRLAAQDRAFMGEEEASAFLACDVAALVADRPVDASIGAEPQAVHVMSGVGDVPAEAGRDDFLHVRYAVAIGVLETPDVRNRRHIDPVVKVEDAGGDARDRRVETFGEDRDLVGDAVAVGIGELVDAFLVEGEVLPVDRPVLVMVFQAASAGLQLARSEFALIESQFVGGRRQADVIRDPEAVFADVEVTRLATRRGSHVSISGLVERDRSRIRHVEVARPLERLHLSPEADDDRGEKGEGGQTHGFNRPGRDRVLSDRGASAPWPSPSRPGGSAGRRSKGRRGRRAQA